jgi:endonuclease/exonuclease/phosphatase family metal-dependent hydrolase
MKHCLALLFLLVATIAMAGEKVRVLTYNIHHGEGTDGKLDLERIAAVIRSVDPDFVAVQEVDIRTTRTGGVDQAAELSRLTKMHAVFGKTIDHQGGWYGNALLSRWPLQGMKAHALPFTPGREKRGILEGAALLPVPLRFFATHFDITEADRITASAAMAEVTAGVPAILAGDLNAVPGSKPIQALLEAGWTSAAPASLLTSPAESPKRQIDYVMFYPRNNWRVVEVRVLDEPVASDHRPLFVILERN